MSIFSKLFGSKRNSNKQKEHLESILEDPIIFDDPIQEEINFGSTPDNLPEAVRYVIDKWGKDFLLNRGFINVLNDFKVLKDMPAAKHVITNMQANGYMEKITLAQNWALESKSISIKYADEFGAREDIVDFIVRCFGYGLGKISDAPKLTERPIQEQKTFTDPQSQPITIPSPTNRQPSPNPTPKPAPQPVPQQLAPYEPKLDLPNYRYPTLGLLNIYDNRESGLVSILDILNSSKYQNSTMELSCAIGSKEDGSILMFDLAQAPHLMISGASGMGVSVCFNTIITSLLYKKHPAEMKLVLIDPKKIEFSLYSPLEKYFLAALPDNEAVVTDMGMAYKTLQSIEKMMTSRLDLFKEVAVRDIKSYNRKFCDRKIVPRNGHGFMPYLVVLIDEYDELIRSSGKGIETFLESIARMGRVTGIHLVLSVLRPVASVISAGIKANMPSRISFRVTSANDSRNILGISGAEKLQKPGEMIYTNGLNIFKSKCAYINLQEIDRINHFIAEQEGYKYAYELPDPDIDDSTISSQDVDMQHLDPMFEDAARLIVREQSGSTSLIQRKFAIGYNRAGHLMDQLEKAGIVGTAHGSKPREVLIMDEMSLENLFRCWGL